jgi:hypothetical protein
VAGVSPGELVVFSELPAPRLKSCAQAGPIADITTSTVRHCFLKWL